MDKGEKQLSDLPKTAHKTDMVTKYDTFDCSTVPDVDFYHGDETSHDQSSIPDIDHLYDLNTVGIRIMLDEYWKIVQHFSKLSPTNARLQFPWKQSGNCP